MTDCGEQQRVKHFSCLPPPLSSLVLSCGTGPFPRPLVVVRHKRICHLALSLRRVLVPRVLEEENTSLTRAVTVIFTNPPSPVPSTGYLSRPRNRVSTAPKAGVTGAPLAVQYRPGDHINSVVPSLSYLFVEGGHDSG